MGMIVKGSLWKRVDGNGRLPSGMNAISEDANQSLGTSERTWQDVYLNGAAIVYRVIGATDYERLRIHASGTDLAIKSEAGGVGVARDLLLSTEGSTSVRIAPGGDVLSQSRTTNAQTFRIYNTTDSDSSPVNWERGLLWWTSNILHVGTEAGGTGTSRAMRLMTAGAARWDIGATTGHLLPVADNTYDFGATAARLRSIYIGTSISIGTNPASTGFLRLANNDYIYARDAGNSANHLLIGLSSSDIVEVGNSGTQKVRIAPSGGQLGVFGSAGAARTSLAAATGTATRTTFDTATVTTAQLAERVKAMIDDLRATGYFA